MGMARGKKLNRSVKQQIKMETVKDAGKPSYDEMYTRIADIVRDYFREFFGSDDDVAPSKISKDVPLNCWHGCMVHVFNSYVSHIDTGIYKYKPWHYGGAGEIGAYDMDIVEDLAQVYITLCQVYDKPQSAVAFADMAGINNNTISAWGHSDVVDDVTSRRFAIYKMITGKRKESITNRVLDGGARTLGAVTIYNNEVLAGAQSVDALPIKKAIGLPDLGGSD